MNPTVMRLLRVLLLRHAELSHDTTAIGILKPTIGGEPGVPGFEYKPEHYYADLQWLMYNIEVEARNAAMPYMIPANTSPKR